MSDHKWFNEHIESALADGLNEAERKRFDKHAADCDNCAAQLEQAEKVDVRLEALFTAARPKAAIDERVLGSLPESRRYARFRSMRILRFAAAMAAMIVLAFVGWTVQGTILDSGALVDATASGGPAGSLILFTDGSKSKSISADGKRLPIGGEMRDVDQMVDEIFQMPEISLWRKQPPALPSRRHDPVIANDIDPAEIKDYQDIDDISIPGLVDPNDVVGITDAKETPPTDMPAPPGFDNGEAFEGANNAIPEKKWFRPGDAASIGSSFDGTFTGRSGESKGNSKGPPNKPKTGKGDKKEASAAQGTAIKRLEGKDKRLVPAKQPAAQPAAQPEPKPGRKIIRSGEMAFEVDSFDKAVTLIKNLVKNPGFVATVNSDRLDNGKVRGSVTVRVPPEHLDDLVSNLRKDIGKFGTLRSQRIGSQDVTKQYTDMESRLRASRTMEERLLRIIKDGKGEVKDLLLAEKELGVWRTKIEELEGELRYYSNLISLSTLTINLEEKEIQQAAYVEESERVQAGMEVDDVEKTMQSVLAAVKEKKGRVFKSELKQHGAGQYNAVLHFEVSPEEAGPMRDRLRQVGNLTRLQIDRLQTTPNSNNVPRDAKVKYGDTQFFLSIYNLANVAPRETVTLKYAAKDVAKFYHELRELVTMTKGKVRNALLNEGDQKAVTARLDFDIRRSAEAEVQKALSTNGTTLSRNATRVPDSENVTDAKVLYKMEIIPVSAIPPRETVTLKFAATDVVKVYQELRDLVMKAGGKVRNAQLNEQDQLRVTARLDFEVGRAMESNVQKTLTASGVVVSRKSVRSSETQDAANAKVLYQVELVPITSVPPRETITVGVEVVNVKKAATFVRSQVKDKSGRSGQAVFAQSQDGRVTARIICEVPLGKAVEFIEEVKSTGIVRIHNVTYNAQAPDGKLAVARVVVTLSNQQQLVPEDEGLWKSVRNGLSVSLRGLSSSVGYLIIGVLFVVPWLLILWIVVVIARRMWRNATPAVSGSAAGTTVKAESGVKERSE